MNKHSIGRAVPSLDGKEAYSFRHKYESNKISLTFWQYFLDYKRYNGYARTSKAQLRGIAGS